MCITTDAELSSHAHELPVILPPRRSHALPSNPGRYGIDPAPIGAHDGEPLTLGESLRFWVVVWICCVLGGITWGALIGYLRGAM